MRDVLLDLADALRERLDIIRDDESRRDQQKHIARLQAISGKIDMLVARLPREQIDPQLAHFLQRGSYDKALEFIENTTRRSTAR